MNSPYDQQLQRPLALIIEDNEAVADVFRAAGEHVGFETKIILDGWTALTQLTMTPPPALILLDIHLPRVSGLEIFKQIQGNELLSQTKVIVAPADPQKAEILESQADFVLLKPISFRLLLNLLGQLSGSNITQAQPE